jgi:PIN domain nuclease of toxin-antitoxin system
MKILLDTHCWLWWITTPEKLGPESQQLIMDGRNEIFLSAASSWEIAIKYALAKLPLPEAPEKFIPPRLVRDAIRPLPINHTHALHVASLPLHHRDPFDRLLISQAQMEGLPIMTVDKQFKDYDVECIWGTP